jgi:plasmid maintenance system antidote protein VapI
VTVDTALRLARVLGTSAQFWINLHEARERWEAVHGPNAKEIEKLEPLHPDREGRLVGSA